MTTRRRVAALVFAVALIAPARAIADDACGTPCVLHVSTPSTLNVSGSGVTITLPPGYFQDEPTRSRVDLEVRRLQDAETRLTVENHVLRAEASKWSWGWKAAAVTLAAGLAAGFYAGHRYW